ncbi:transcription factor MYB35 [Vicia villosa]|uniref:transcription factor MYB35 n=1 Tax=Vicia villosa TaxID=3911 RepID=UPI00273BAC3A|nr:transcription factor MYB35 [Vicia villosa]
MVRSASCEKNSVVKRGVWITEDDGSGNWNSVPKKTGIKRCGKSCRLRWSNNVVDDKLFTSEEEDLIVKLHAAIGSRWSIIAQQLPGRTDNDVKNNWNTKLKKKLSQMGIDPVTHKPFSKLIADYGNIGAKQDFQNANLSHFQTIPITKIKNKANNVAPFSWNDFLIQDAFAPPLTNNQDQALFSKDIVVTKLQLQKNKEVVSSSSSSSDTSFVEAILYQENEMFLSFPELLEEPSHY